jgi:hypothetical protein
MGAHLLDVRYGDRYTIPYYNGILASGILADATWKSACTAGSVYSLTTGGFLVPGLDTSESANGGTMPFYGLSGLDSNNYPDSERSRGMPGYGMVPATGDTVPNYSYGVWGIPSNAGNAVQGAFATIRHNAAVELATTEFDTTAAGSAYVPGQALTVVKVNTGTANANHGKLRPLKTAATDIIVGYVAPAKQYTAPSGYTTLAFTPAWVVPGSATLPTAITG